MALKPLTARDLEVLRDLESANRDRRKNLGAEDEWAKPMDVGAWNGSFHSGVLKKLVRHGVAEIEDASTKHLGRSRYYRAGCRYRINDVGRARLQKERR